MQNLKNNRDNKSFEYRQRANTKHNSSQTRGKKSSGQINKTSELIVFL